MNKTFLTFLIFIITSIVFGQAGLNTTQFNFSFEIITSSNQKLPDNWFQWGRGYNLYVDTLVKHNGKNSVLLQSPDKRTKDDFGCVAYRIPAIFEGKEIELKAFMKLKDVKEGPIGLMLRLDGDSVILGFDNMQQKNIQGTSDWTMYSVKLPYSKNVKTIIIGALLSGTGQLWVDDFEILIDGKAIKPKEYKADKDYEFDEGSKIKIFIPAEEKINDLKILGMVWGLLKYYHPTVAKGDINWDYELFRILPKILKSNSKDDRNKILSEWINSIGAIKENQEPLNIDKSKIKFMPDLEWTKDESELGKVIVAQLKEIKIAKRNSQNYYLNFNASGNAIFEHEDQYNKMTFPDAGFRLLTLYRYWNIIQYYFPYKNLIEDDWNQVLRNFIPEFVKSSNSLEYRLTILKLIEKIHDTHAFIRENDRFLDTVMLDYFGKYTVPCQISFIENKAVITKIYSGADSTIQLKVGDIVEKINGESVDEIIKRRLPITVASNYSTKLRNIAYDILRSNSESVPVTYLHHGQMKTDNVKGVKLGKDYSTSSKIQKKSWKMLDNNIGYLFMETLKESELPEIMKNFQNCKGIIFDHRCRFGSLLYSLGEYLMPAPIQFVKFSRTNFDMPGMFTFTDAVTVGKNNPDYYKGKVVIIVNEITQSAGEFHSMGFRKAPKVTVIGNTTAGADGNVSYFNLPGGITTRITGLGVYYPDGGETQRIGIVPDIEVKPTIKGIIEGRDELLEKAIQIIKDEK